MRFLSVCSGIEAASAAWHPLGWDAVAFSEIEPFPCAVLAHHYPTTPNWGDMTKYKDWPDVSIDLLCGGTPCQSFSVAGLRKGLDDPRGNLMFTFGAIAAKYRPKWLVWENVPGVLSSNGGRDFGAFLGMLGQLGYGFAYRVLDAQHFGVPQRRRRVFVVGCLGDWRRAAAVLFERHSLSGHPAPSRQARQVAPTIPSRSTAGGGLGTDFDLDGGVIESVGFANAGHFGSMQEVSVGDPLRAKGGDTGYGGESIVITMAHSQGGAEIAENRSPTPTCNHEAPIAAYSTKLHNTTSNQAGKVYEGYCTSLDANSPPPAVFAPVSVALRGREGGATAELGDEVQNCLRASSGGGDKAHVLAPAVRDISQTLTSNYGKQVDSSDTALGPNVVFPAMKVRRLTPVECERLQGFPDDYTQIPWRKKPASECPDGPRYKALGNSWAVPVVRWIGARIAAQLTEAA